MALHCRNFSRTQFLREAAAEAGRGLPSVEPGMPLPAGTGLDRRSFMLRSAGLALSVYGGQKLGIDALNAGVAQAQSGGGERVLVSVFLEGGVDSISILAPTGDSRYKRLRPTLALPGSKGTPFREDHRLRWHPVASKLADLHAEGKLTVMPSIGYEGPDQSHFTSRHFYEVGAREANLPTGWLGRYLDVVGTPDNPLQGLALNRQLAPSLAAGRNPVSAANSVTDYTYTSPFVFDDVEKRLHQFIPRLGAAHLGSSDPALREAGAIANDAGALRNQLSRYAARGVRSPVIYPGSKSKSDSLGGGSAAGGDMFPERLAGLAALLSAGVPIRVAALTGPGDHDTHAAQERSFASDVKLTSDSLFAFQRDLEARGLADRVIVHVWSEFGRRAQENGSKGTDHGAGGIGFLMGTQVRGQMLGEFPGLAKLDPQGNLRSTSDFRALYSSILEQWFQTDAAAVIPDASRFGRYALLK